MSQYRIPQDEEGSYSPLSSAEHGSPSRDTSIPDAHIPIASNTCGSKPMPKIDPVSKKEICEIGRDGKYLYNIHAREFGKIVQRRCVDPVDFYASLKKVPYNTKEQWFDAFLNDYIAKVQPERTSEDEGEAVGDNRVDIIDIPFDPDKWVESTGGIRKGHILGFGSEMALFGQGNNGQASQSTRIRPSHDSTSHQELQQLLDEARRREDEAHRREDEAVRREQEMHTRMEEMMETQKIMHQTQIDMQAQLARVLSYSKTNHPRSRGS